MSEVSSAANVEKLTEIWQRVLQRSAIRPDENFFDLSGRDAVADSIFAEIAREFGRELPSATICYAPTIASLAALLTRDALPHFSPFVPLKTGDQEPPIIITHGLGGRASFFELAKHIRTGHAVYGIQGQGVDGMQQPLDSIEEMAGLYLNALGAIQGRGPYILIGYSFGGLVALEMAQRLRRDGEKIALLVLVDTYPHPHFFPHRQRLWLAAKKVKGHLLNMKKMPIGSAFGYMVRGVQHRLHSVEDRGHEISAKSQRLSFAQTIARVKESDFRAMARYQPKFYPGKIKFVRPAANSYLPNDPTALWTPLAAQLEVETVPGDHLGMVGKHFASLAAALTRYVQESDIAQ